jgi:hypothetical protein
VSDLKISGGKKLVSSIRNTEWIDLSPSHKDLRVFLESGISEACVNQDDTPPIMVKGAFGIGKTATLHYLFHYAWTKLHVPTFIVNLDVVNKGIEKYISDNDLEKLPNEKVSIVVGKMINKQIQILKSKDFGEINGGEIYFPDFARDTLSEYLDRFKCADLHYSENGDFINTQLPLFNEVIINSAINSGNRYLLLIDEFEAKYHELKHLVENSGGGLLRDFFNDISSVSSTNYYCIIGNGPASGYEISSSSSAAEVRRFLVKQIHTPTVDILQKFFFKNFPIGHINFYWWLSRSRPGQLKKLKESLQSYDDLKNGNYIDFIRENLVLNDPIDEMGESNVSFLKTDLFESLDINFKNKIKELLIELCAKKINISNNDWKDKFVENKHLFYASNELIKYEDILTVLQRDILGIKNENKKYSEINFNILHQYLDLILVSISNEEKRVSFGMVNRNDVDSTLSITFLLPIFSLLYDFISIYEDETDPLIKLVLDFILELINKSEKEDIETVFSDTYGLFEYNSVRVKIVNEAFFQLSLKTIRETIEQPIGSPKLPYKSESISDRIGEIKTFNKVFVFNNNSQELIIIPKFKESELLDSYIDILESYFKKYWDDKYEGDGELITNIVYFEENDRIREFKKWLLYKDNEEDTKELPYLLKKLDLRHINKYKIHNSERISDFINSMCFIGVVGIESSEIVRSSDEEFLSIDTLISDILDPDWTKSKQNRRTIEYYRDQLLEGENSSFYQIMKIANKSYDDELGKYITDKGGLTQSSCNLSLSDTDHLGAIDASIPTKNFISFLLTNTDSENYSKIIRLLKESVELNLSPTDRNKELTLPHVNYFINHRFKDKIQGFIDDFSSGRKELKGIKRLFEVFNQHTEIHNIDDFLELLQKDKFLFSSYFDYLGFSTNKSYFLKGLFLNQLQEQILDDDYVDQLSENLKDKNEILRELSNQIFEKGNRLKELYGSNDVICESTEIDQYFTKLIVPLLSQMESNGDISLFICGTCVSEGIKIFIDNANNFISQMDILIEIMGPTYETIQNKQRQINSLYGEDDESLIRILFKDKYSRNRNGNYLFKQKFIPSIKLTDGGSVYEKLFMKEYSPSDIIEGQHINRIGTIIHNSFEDKELEFDETLKTLEVIYKDYIRTEWIENKIKEMMGLEVQDLEIDINSLDAYDNTDEFDYLNIDEKFDLAIRKQNDTENLNNDQSLLGKWRKIVENKKSIDSLDKYDRHSKEINRFFNEVYEVITAPGLQLFIDWVRQNDNKNNVTDKKIKWIRSFLLEEYNEYESEIDSIVESLDIIDSNGSIFNDSKSQIRVNIIKFIINCSSDEKEHFEQDFTELIHSLHSLFNDLKSYEELSFTNVRDFYTDETSQVNLNIDYYSEIIDKIVKTNDFISTNQGDVSVDDLSGMVNENITDIKESIEQLDSLDVGIDSSDTLKILFDKYGQSLVFKNAGNVEGDLRDSLEKVWEQIVEKYEIIDLFFKNNNYATINNFKHSFNEWDDFSFAPALIDYLDGAVITLSDNPINNFQKYDFDEIKKQLSAISKKITGLNENELKDELSRTFTEIIDDYSNTKIPILSKPKLNILPIDIEKIDSKLKGIHGFINNINESNNLVETLNEQFEHLIRLVEEVSQMYKGLLENTDVGAYLPFLDNIKKDGDKIEAKYLQENLDEIKILLEYDLINIDIRKNI